MAPQGSSTHGGKFRGEGLCLQAGQEAPAASHLGQGQGWSSPREPGPACPGAAARPALSPDLSFQTGGLFPTISLMPASAQPPKRTSLGVGARRLHRRQIRRAPRSPRVQSGGFKTSLDFGCLAWCLGLAAQFRSPSGLMKPPLKPVPARPPHSDRQF